MQLIGMLDSPYVRRVAVTMLTAGVAFRASPDLAVSPHRRILEGEPAVESADPGRRRWDDAARIRASFSNISRRFSRASPR